MSFREPAGRERKQRAFEWYPCVRARLPSAARTFVNRDHSQHPQSEINARGKRIAFGETSRWHPVHQAPFFSGERALFCAAGRACVRGARPFRIVSVGGRVVRSFNFFHLSLLL